MNITFLAVGIASMLIGVIMMTRSKFYRYKISDMMFNAKMRTFLSAAILVIYGVLALYYEIKKMLH